MKAIHFHVHSQKICNSLHTSFIEEHKHMGQMRIIFCCASYLFDFINHHMEIAQYPIKQINESRPPIS